MLPLDARDAHVHQILLLLHLDHTRRVPDLGGCVLLCYLSCGVYRYHTQYAGGYRYHTFFGGLFSPALGGSTVFISTWLPTW